MVVRGLFIPVALSSRLEAGQLKTSRADWWGTLKQEKDAFGLELESELADFFSTEERMERATKRLEKQFAQPAKVGSDDEPTIFDADDDDEITGPGAIESPTEFDRIVCFARSGDDGPFCLDYRQTPDCPRVIWWDDCYWRAIAPNMQSFLELFHLTKPQ